LIVHNGSIARIVGRRRDDRGRAVITYRWRADLPVGADGVRRQKKMSGFPTRAAAAASLREYLSELERGEVIVPAELTVAQAVEAWLAARRNVEPTTVRCYRDALAHVTAAIGERKVQTVNRRDLDRVVTGMLNAGRSPRTIRLTMGCARRVFRDAVRDGVIRTNPTEFVELPSGRSKEMRTWTPSQVQAFAQVAAAHRLAPAWRLTLAGLRRSEVMGLRWADLNLDAATVTVAQARVSLDGATTYVKAPKTERGNRVLPLDAAAVRGFRAFRAQAAAERLAFGAAYDTSHDLVVVNEAGRPVRPELYGDEFARLAQVAGVPRIRLHDARHTCASYLHAQGLPIAAISAWLGHSSPAFTFRQYVHASADALTQARDLLANALGG
jgi:integrase